MSIEVKGPKPSNATLEMVAEINQQFDSAKDLVVETYNRLVLSDGFTPKQAKKFLYENVTIFSDRTIRKYLPEEAIDVSKRRPHFAEALPQIAKTKSPISGAFLKEIMGEKNVLVLPERRNNNNYNLGSGGSRSLRIDGILVGIEKPQSTDLDCFYCLPLDRISTFKTEAELFLHLIYEHHEGHTPYTPEESAACSSAIKRSMEGLE